MALDFSKLAPWKNIETVTIDGQIMVKIPKFYVKVGIAPEGTDQAGKKCWWVSPDKRNGYHVHPAFMRRGEEIDQFYIGAYEASADASDSTKAASLAGKSPRVSITFDQSQAMCEARNTADGVQSGWHLQTFYERSAIAMLMMIELGSPDVQTKIGAGNSNSSAAVATGNSNAIWRGIHEFWGNVWEWTDGLKTLSDGLTVMIFDNLGYQTYINTGVRLPSASASGIQEVFDTKGENFDLADVFVPKTVSGAANASTFSDGCWTAAGEVRGLVCGGRWDYGASGGAFTFRTDHAPSGSGASFGLRLAKY